MVRKGFVGGAVLAQGVQDGGGGGRDRWCGSAGMRKSRVGGMCAAQRRRVLEGCGGCSGRRLRACVFKAGVPSRQGISMNQVKSK